MSTTALKFKTEALRKLQLRFAWESPDFAGAVGEALARESLDALGISYSDVDQSKGGIHRELAAWGGKRPDFILDTWAEDHIVLVDAKYHQTDGLTRFALTETEVVKYRNLEAYTKQVFPDANVDIIFFVYPKEGLGNSLAVIHLSEFDGGAAFAIREQPAISISLAGKLIDPKTGAAI